MATAILDIDINEGDTFVMSLEFWSDADNTIPIDVTTDTFYGSFVFGTRSIPMTITKLTPAINVIEATVAYSQMGDLPKQGKYDIDQLTAQGERYRVIQGVVRTNAGVTV